MTPGKGSTLLADLANDVEKAEAFKASKAGSVEKGIQRKAKSLHDALADADRNEQMRADLTDLMAELDGDVEGTFDRTSGDLLASIAQAELAKPEDYRLAGFDAVKAEELVGSWKKAMGGRGTGNGGASQRTPVPIKVTFTFPDGHTDTITHNYWSSVSNEITGRAKELDGFEGRGYKRPEEAKEAWRAAVKSIKDEGDGGTVTIPTKAGDLVAVVEAVR